MRTGRWGSTKGVSSMLLRVFEVLFREKISFGRSQKGRVSVILGFKNGTGCSECRRVDKGIRVRGNEKENE